MDNILEIKQLNIKNRTYYFWDDIIYIDNFNPNLLKVDTKNFLDYNVYNISYVTKTPEYNINSVNPLYLCIKYLKGFIDELDGKTYLKVSLADNDNGVIIKYLEVFDGIKDNIKKLNAGLPVVYDKNYMKIQLETNDVLPLNKLMKFHALTIVIRQVFEKDNVFYPQIFLDDYLYEYV